MFKFFQRLSRDWKAYSLLDKLRDGYNGGELNRNYASFNMAAAGKELQPQHRSGVLRDILDLNLRAMVKEDLHPATPIVEVMEALAQMDIPRERFLKAVLIPYTRDHQSDLIRAGHSKNARVLQTLFYHATEGKGFEREDVAVSGQLGAYYADICVIFKNVAKPFALAEERVLPVAEMRNYLNRRYSWKLSEPGEKYTGFMDSVKVAPKPGEPVSPALRRL